MSRRVGCLLALLGVLSVAGWVLAARLDRLEGSAEAAAVLTALVLGLAVVAASADRRSPGGWLGVQASLVACTIAASAYRVFPDGPVAAVGALVWLASALLVPELLVRYPDDRDPRTRAAARWACRVTPAVLALAIVVTSGPRSSGGAAVRAVTWSVGGPEGSPDWQRNPFGLLPSTAAVRALTLAWALWCVAVAVWVGLRLVRRWRQANAVAVRSERAVALAGLVALAGTVVNAVGAFPVASARDPSEVLSTDRWYGTALYATGVLALPALVAVLGWFEVVRPRLARTAGGALELGPTVDDADAALARLLDDPGVCVDYRADGAWVDGAGEAVADEAGPDSVLVVRGGVALARLRHVGALSDRPEELDAAARLVALLLDNSRLRADTLARAEEVRASGARLLEAADQARRDLEARIEHGPVATLRRAEQVLGVPEPGAAELEAVVPVLRDALGEVRAISHGLTPPVLADEGLAGALVVLADATHRPLELRSLPAERLPGPVETTAFLLVQEAMRDAPLDRTLVLDLVTRDGELAVEVAGWSAGLSPMLTDRVDTLGGVVEPCEGGQVVRLPLATGAGVKER